MDTVRSWNQNVVRSLSDISFVHAVEGSIRWLAICRSRCVARKHLPCDNEEHWQGYQYAVSRHLQHLDQSPASIDGPNTPIWISRLDRPRFEADALQVVNSLDTAIQVRP